MIGLGPLADLAFLERTFVVRQQLVDQLAADMAATIDQGGARFELLLGPSGSGKSHLLQILLAKLDEALDERVLVVELSERLRVASLLGLLTAILQAMPTQEGDTPTEVQVRSLRDDPSTAVARAVEMIQHRLGTRCLVLAVEKLDRHLEAMGRTQESRLRGILQTLGTWNLIGTASSLSPAFTDIDRAFFHTFVVHELPELTALECRQLLHELATWTDDRQLAHALASDGGLARVAALRHVCGGQPRVMVRAFRHMDAVSLDAVEPVLDDLAHELGPRFDERMDGLPAGQAVLVDVLARSWGPLTVGELAHRTFATHQTTSGQLRYLLRDGWVSAQKIGRERLYELADPLHRLVAGNRYCNDRASESLAFLRDWYRHGQPQDLEAMGAPDEVIEAWRQREDRRKRAALAEVERRVVADAPAAAP